MSAKQGIFISSVQKELALERRAVNLRSPRIAEPLFLARHIAKSGTKSGTKLGTKSAASPNPRQSQYWRGFDGFDGCGQKNQPDQVQGPSHPAIDGPRLAGNDPARQTHQQPTEIPPHRARRGVAGQSDRKEKMNIREHTAGKLAPFAQEGGMGRVHQLFGAELPKVLEAMNRELAA